MINTKNVLLVKSELGKTFPITRDLPSASHIYGRQLPKNEPGVKDCNS